MILLESGPRTADEVLGRHSGSRGVWSSCLDAYPPGPILITRTSTLLLQGLQDPKNTLAWSELQGRYQPILLRFAHKLGLGDSDAEDLAQETLVVFVKGYLGGKYERERGRLRSWLFGIAENVHRASQRKRDRDRVGDDQVPCEGAVPSPLEELFEAEWRRALIGAALAELREQGRLAAASLQAFELVALEQREVSAVATQLAMSKNAVHIANHRVRDRLAPILKRLHAEF